MATQRSLKKAETAEGQNPFVALEKYDPTKYNILCPPAAVQARLGFGYVLSVEEVTVSSDYAEKEVYKVGSRPKGNSWEDEVTFYGTTLNRLANAAGISYATRRIDDRRDPQYVEFQAMGTLKKADGTHLIATRTKGFDLREIEQEVIEQQTKKVRYLIKKGEIKPQHEAFQIKSRVKAEMQQKRKHRVALCETGAILRVFRALIGMKSSYPISALNKPFVLPRIDFRPDSNDPDVKRMLIEQGFRSEQEVFGPSARSLPAGDTRTDELPEDDAEPVEDAEVIDNSVNEVGAEEVPQEMSADEKASHHLADLKALDGAEQIAMISKLRDEKGLGKIKKDLLKMSREERIDVILQLEKLPVNAPKKHVDLGELFEGGAGQ